MYMHQYTTLEDTLSLNIEKPYQFQLEFDMAFPLF